LEHRKDEGSAVFVNVGAYVGGYTLRAAKLGLKVVAVEPDKGAYALLRRNVEENGFSSRASLFNYAAGEKEELAPFYRGVSLKPVKGNSVVDYVEVKTLDHLLYGTSVLAAKERVLLMKIDVEEAEYEVLKGADRALRNTKYLIVEVWPHNKRSVVNYLNERGFHVIDRIESGFGIQNMLFKRTH